VGCEPANKFRLCAGVDKEKVNPQKQSAKQPNKTGFIKLGEIQ
jgi:hypothetical protein